MPALTRPRLRAWIIPTLLLLFVIAGLIRFRHPEGSDLASSYLGCRVLAAGQPAHLFVYDPEDFAAVGPDPVWHAMATSGNYHSWFHPYLQTPLWAWSIEPLCTRLQFPAFAHLFELLALLSIAAILYLVARFWATYFLRPLPFAAILLLVFFCRPFTYAMWLVQTHALYLVLVVAGLILAPAETPENARRNRPILAGLLVALAAAVKITPAALLVYWLIARRWRAAISLALCSLALLLFARLAVGPHLFADWLISMHRVSRILLLAENNQSFAAWIMGPHYPPDAVYDVSSYPLPDAIRIASTLLLLLFTAAAGLLERARAVSSAERNANSALGAAAALTAITVFAPIAWTHYFFLLAVPIMVLVQQSRALGRTLGSKALLLIAGIAALLLLPPFAADVEAMEVGDYALLRGQFYAALLCLLGIALAAYLRHRASRTALSAF